MTQIFDRHADMRATHAALTRDASTSYGPSSPPKTPREGADKDESRAAKASPSAGTSNRWASAFEEPSIARVQQFIVETLKNPIRFLKSELPVAQPVPYKAINDPKVIAERNAASADKKGKAPQNGLSYDDKPAKSVNGSPTKASVSSTPTPSPAQKKIPDLFSYTIALRPPKMANECGVGLINRGNTCYMNSTLQALLHLPPLSNALLMLDDDQLYGRFGTHPSGHKFDAIDAMQELANRSLRSKNSHGSISPMVFIKELKSYARPLVPYRQEDAHEYLRFLLEAMQYCCLARAPKSLKPFDPLRETTFVHKIFGGKLRSRVQCGRCKYNSDTFDPILDLSLDIRNLRSNTINSALDLFTGIDELRGSEKYRCEKCKMNVNATKQFTIHQAPPVLTIHLKRFTLTGQKISKTIAFGENLVLAERLMSDGQAQQRYRLHAVVHHFGGGPNSGHYVASVRGNSGRWFEMNDSTVSPMRGPPVNAPHAYILFYVRLPSSSLEEALRPSPKVAVPSLALLDKKRRLESEDEDDDSETDQQRTKVPKSVSSPANSQDRIPFSSPTMKRFKTRLGLQDNGRTFDGDEDDLGESIESSRAGEASTSYESLTGAGIEPASPSRAMSKKQRRKMRGSLKETLANSSMREDESSRFTKSPTQARAAQSRVDSPYFAGNKRFSAHPQSPRGINDPGQFRQRMRGKAKQGNGRSH